MNLYNKYFTGILLKANTPKNKNDKFEKKTC